MMVGWVFNDTIKSTTAHVGHSNFTVKRRHKGKNQKSITIVLTSVSHTWHATLSHGLDKYLNDYFGILLYYRINASILSHRCSIGEILGERTGHSNTSTLFRFNKSMKICVVCAEVL